MIVPNENRPLISYHHFAFTSGWIVESNRGDEPAYTFTHLDFMSALTN